MQNNNFDGHFTLLMVVLCLLLTGIPYFYGYATKPADKVYTGLAGRDVPGAFMYFMWELQSKDGQNFFENMLTPERQSRSYFNPEWWLLGKFLRYSGLPVITGFHVERSLTVILAIFSMNYFLSCFFQNSYERRWAFLFVFFTSGLGWVFQFMKKSTASPSLSIKLWDTEGVNFWGYLVNKPHFIRSLLFICLTYAFLLKGEETRKTRYYFAAGLGFIVFGFIRPYDLPAAYVLTALYTLLLCLKNGAFAAARIKNYLVLITTSLPIVIYYAYLYFITPLKEVWKGFSITPLTPLEFVIWLGIPFLIACWDYCGFSSLKNLSEQLLFLYLWAVVMAINIYSYPIVSWGMESAGVCYIIAPIIASLALFRKIIPAIQTSAFTGKIKGRTLAFWIMAGIFGGSLPSNLFFMNHMIHELSGHSRPYYLSKNDAAAFDWLRHHAHNEDVVLSGADNGFYFPTFSRTRAFVGHGDFTIDYNMKKQMVSRFFDGNETAHFRENLIKVYHITYVYWGKIEKSIGAYDPDQSGFLRKVYENSDVAIYRVVQGAQQSSA